MWVVPRGLGLKVCAREGCAALGVGRYCAEHTKVQERRAYSEYRALYSSRKWRRFRIRILRRDGWRCKWAEGCSAWANEVDHIVPLTDWNGSPFDERNVQSLCKRHHSMKTAQEVWHQR